MALPGKANISEEKEETYLKGTRFMALQKLFAYRKRWALYFEAYFGNTKNVCQMLTAYIDRLPQTSFSRNC